MTTGLSYKFNGSSFSVQTSLGGASPTPAITAISKTDPIVVTSAAHPFSNDDVVKISAVVGPTNLNGGLYVVDSKTTNDFALLGQDGTNNDTYVSGGLLNLVVFSVFCELTTYNRQGAAADQIDVSTICTDDFKEFVQGLRDTGTLQLDFNGAPDSSVQMALENAGSEKLAFKLVAPGGTAWGLMAFGTVTSTSFSGTTGDIWKGGASIKLSGAVIRYM